MARRTANLIERIKQLEFDLYELKEQYATQLYFETMPDYDPVYKYCYATSNMRISHQHQHIDYWLRAVIRHMATRSEGHGGASTSAVLVSVPIGFSEAGIDKWLSYINPKLKKEAMRHSRKR